jgi:uncharacterized protein (DUF2062 family)
VAEIVFWANFRRWVTNQLPRRETIGNNWLLRPFARQLSQPNLWHLNNRSIPRAVAIGLGVGMIIPFMHMILAALLAIPARANVAVAAACTLVVNPLTIPAMYYAAYKIGRWELRQETIVDPSSAVHISGELSRMLFWVHEASGPIALGIITMALGAATVGYVVSALLWRLWVASKWRERRQVRRAQRTAD